MSVLLPYAVGLAVGVEDERLGVPGVSLGDGHGMRLARVLAPVDCSKAFSFVRERLLPFTLGEACRCAVLLFDY